MAASSKPITGVGVADRNGEEAESDGQHDQVQHLDAPLTRSPCRAVNAPYRCIINVHQEWGEKVSLPPIDEYLPLTAYFFERESKPAVYESHIDSGWGLP